MCFETIRKLLTVADLVEMGLGIQKAQAMSSILIGSELKDDTFYNRFDSMIFSRNCGREHLLANCSFPVNVIVGIRVVSSSKCKEAVNLGIVFLVVLLLLVRIHRSRCRCHFSLLIAFC